jgi:hypothetical protein
MTFSKQTPAVDYSLQSDRKRMLDARAGGVFGGAESSNDWSINLTPPNAPRPWVTISSPSAPNQEISGAAREGGFAVRPRAPVRPRLTLRNLPVAR